MRASLLITLILSSTLGMAQPAGETFPDFTFNDIEGNTHHLQSYLDQGKTVVIDVFATWCGVCQSSVGGMEELYSTYGQGGDESMVVLTFERDPNTSNEASFISNYGVESPVITEATETIDEVWNVTYQPRYFVICPDGSFGNHLSGGIYNNPQPLIDLSEDCGIASSLSEEEFTSAFSLQSTQFSSQIEYSCTSDQLSYALYDLTGALVQEGRLESGTSRIDVGSVPSGIFLLHISDGEQAITHKLIKSS